MNNSTYSNNAENTFDEVLTIDKIYEAMELLKEIPPMPFIAYSWAVPYGEVYKGDEIDKIIKLMHPEFNPKIQQGFLVSEGLRGEIEEITNKL